MADLGGPASADSSFSGGTPLPVITAPASVPLATDASATTQPATPSGTVSSAPAASLDANTLASLLAGIGGSATPPGALTPTAASVPVTQQATATGGGPNLLLWGLLAAAVLVGYLWWKKHHAGHHEGAAE